MIEQKAKIAATKKRKLQEELKKDEEPKAKVFKGECKHASFLENFWWKFYSATKDVAKERFGTSTRSFWEPGTEPEADKTAFKQKDVTKVKDPVTGSTLKLKNLFAVKFTPVDPSLSDAKRQASKSRWKVFNLLMNLWITLTSTLSGFHILNDITLIIQKLTCF